MSAPLTAEEFIDRIAEGSVDYIATHAQMAGKAFDLSLPGARVVSEHIATGVLGYLSHLAERYGAEGELEAFYQRVGAGMGAEG